MNAAGRVPCRCGATLILDPAKDRRAVSSPDLTSVDIVTLGYLIRVERTARAFDAAHNGLRDGLGLNTAGTNAGAAPDPARAGHASLLWPALGAAWDPRLVLPAEALGFTGLSARWAVHWFYAGGPLIQLLEFAAALVAFALAAAIATVASATAIHGVVVETRPLGFGSALRRVLREQRALLGSAAREALLFALGTVSAVIAVASMIAIADRGGTAAVLSRVSAPVQVIGMLMALTSLLALVGALLVHAGATPYAAGRMGVQITVETRRLWGRRGVVPARAFVPGLVAALALAFGLGLLVMATARAWDAVAGTVTDPGNLPRGIAHAVGIDLLLALAGGVWTSFVSVAGLLGGYALGSGAPTDPVRAPDIITGTQQSIELPPEERPPPTRLATEDVVTGLVMLPPLDNQTPAANAPRPTSPHNSPDPPERG
jgi:hypothetical protein